VKEAFTGPREYPIDILKHPDGDVFTEETDEENHRLADGLVKALQPYDDDDFKIADFIDELAGIKGKKDMKMLLKKWEQEDR
jgi:hypothetical protein